MAKDPIILPEIKENVSLPIYKNISEHIISWINQGELRENDILEPEEHLANRLQVSRMTVNKAYQQLLSRGFVQRVKKKGTIVLKPPIKNPYIGNISVVLPVRIKNSILPLEQEYLFGFQQEMQKKGYSTSIVFMDSRKKGACPPIPISQGILSVGQNPPYPFEMDGVPIVQVAGWKTTVDQHAWILSDNHQGGRLAAKVLLQHGHRRVACYTPQMWHGGVLERIESFRDTIIKEGGTIKGNLCPTQDSLVTLNDLSKVFRSKNRPTAIFCISEVAAIEVIDLAIKSGLKVPNDLSVISFDGGPLTEYYRPRISHIAVDRLAIGQKAAQILFERIENNYDHRQNIWKQKNRFVDLETLSAI